MLPQRPQRNLTFLNGNDLVRLCSFVCPSLFPLALSPVHSSNSVPFPCAPTYTFSFPPTPTSICLPTHSPFHLWSSLPYIPTCGHPFLRSCTHPSFYLITGQIPPIPPCIFLHGSRHLHLPAIVSSSSVPFIHPHAIFLFMFLCSVMYSSIP